MNPFCARRKAPMQEYFGKVVHFQYNPSLVHDYSIYDATDVDYQFFHAVLNEIDVAALFKEKSRDFSYLLDKLGPYSHKKLINELEENDQKMIREHLEHRPDYEILCAAYMDTLLRNNGRPRKTVLVISRNKVHLFKSKDKLLKEFHLLDLVKIESEKPNELTIGFHSNNTDENISCTSDSPEKIDDLITSLRRTYAYIFHNNSNFQIKVKPESRLNKQINLQDNSPCSGLVQTYKSLCDYYEGTTVNTSVCYALENFYSRNRVLDFDKFINSSDAVFSFMNFVKF